MKAEGSRSKGKLNINAVPGMTEPVEQVLLERLARETEFTSGDMAVEFGPFFGRSTASICAGLDVNQHFDSSCDFYSYDSFCCDVKGGFYPHVIKHATRYQVQNLIALSGDTVNFFPVFEHFLREDMQSGLLTVVKAELKDSYAGDRPIRLMHVDSPKRYTEFRYVFFRFFPHLEKGSVVVFQDFFYHWSASLIAVCAVMAERGYLRFTESAASSLVCVVEKNFEYDAILEIDILLSQSAKIPSFIDDAIGIVTNLTLDRPEIFVPRLVLAKIQWLYEQGERDRAVDEILMFINRGGRINSQLVGNFLELMRSEFSMSEYDLDHS